jgi:NADPH-dependent ferric siderophore reductase
MAFRFVCVPAALQDAPGGWTRDMLEEGEIALLPDSGGLPAVNAVAHTLGLPSIALVRGEDDAARQEETVIAHAGSLPLVWVAPAFSESAQRWARERGPMTLLVVAAGPLSDEERRRIDRFVATLGRQSE